MRQSVKPQIPFCTKRKVVALIIYRLERVCATHFLRPKAVGRVGFKSDLPIDGYHRQMVNRIFSPTLPEYRPARWARWRACGGRLGVSETRKASRWLWVSVGSGWVDMGKWVAIRKPKRRFLAFCRRCFVWLVLYACVVVGGLYGNPKRLVWRVVAL